MRLITQKSQGILGNLLLSAKQSGAGVKELMFSDLAYYTQPVAPRDPAFYSIGFYEILFFWVVKLFPIFSFWISEDSLLSITFE